MYYDIILHYLVTRHDMYTIVFRSDKPRRACVVNYFADGVRSDVDEPMMNGLPLIRKVNSYS